MAPAKKNIKKRPAKKNIKKSTVPKKITLQNGEIPDIHKKHFKEPVVEAIKLEKMQSGETVKSINDLEYKVYNPKIGELCSFYEYLKFVLRWWKFQRNLQN